jgi:hypothetical protein
MTETFESRDELKERLLAAQEGRLAAGEFIRSLLTSQVFLPVEYREPIAGFQMSSRANPLAVQSEQGYKVLMLFSSPERAKPFVAHFPAFQGGSSPSSTGSWNGWASGTESR